MSRLIALFALSFCALSAHAAETDTWMAVKLDGRQVGHMKTTRSLDPEGITTVQALDFQLARGKEPLTVQSNVTSVESPAGQPRSFLAKSRSSAQEDVAEATARPDGSFQLSTLVGGQQTVSLMTWPEGAMLNEGQRVAMVTHGFRPGTRYTSRNFDPVHQRVVELAITVVGDEVIDMPGGPETLHHLKQVLAANPTAPGIDAWVDNQANVRRSLAPLFGFRMEMVACDEACALAPVQGVDVLRSAMLQSPRLLTPSMRDAPIKYTLIYRGKEPNPFIDTNEQEVTPLGEGLYEMLVTRPRLMEGVSPPTPEDTAPNAWVQSTAPEVVELAKKAVGNATTDLQRIRRLRSFVTDYITSEGLDVSYASALETIATRRGDCTEFAVLLAALARSQGIPTRVVSGLVYTDRFAGASRMFVPHTWDQVWLEDRWVSFDAAQRQFDTTHIALSVGNGDPWRFFAVMNVLGDMRISRAAALELPQAPSDHSMAQPDRGASPMPTNASPASGGRG